MPESAMITEKKRATRDCRSDEGAPQSSASAVARPAAACTRQHTVCRQCSQPFEARGSKVYCSNVCRWRAANARAAGTSPTGATARGNGDGRGVGDVGFADYFAAVEERLRIGAMEYGGRSLEREPSGLVAEVRDEIADIGGWSALLWRRLDRVEDELPLSATDWEVVADAVRAYLPQLSGFPGRAERVARLLERAERALRLASEEGSR
jgi:hypothetical protein